MLRVGLIFCRRLKRAGLRLSLLGRLDSMLLVCEWFVGIMGTSISSSTGVPSSSFINILSGMPFSMLCGKCVVRAGFVSRVLTFCAAGGHLAVSPRGDFAGRGDLASPRADLASPRGDLVLSFGGTGGTH